MQLPVGCGGPVSQSLRLDIQLTIPAIETHFKNAHIFCMANGQLGAELKFFFHCQLHDRSGFFMIESLFNLQTKMLNFTVKGTRPDLDLQFLKFVNGVFS